MSDIASRLDAYADLVRSWAPKLDLVAPGDLPRFRERHIDDSLRALPVLDAVPEGACLDVGSGAGLPGIPLAIARPERLWRLLEPRRRRAAFLDEVVRTFDLDCEVLTLTAEAAARRDDLRAGHALAVARALAPPPRAFRLLLPLVRPRGAALVFVGTGAEIPTEAEEWQEGLAIIVAS